MISLFSALLVARLARWTTATETGPGLLPACAMSCIEQNNITSCATTDMACRCADVPFLAAVKQCVLTSCTAKEGLATQKFISGACHASVRDQSDKLVAIVCVFTALAIAAMAARLYTRYLVFGKMVFGDYVATFNLCLSLGDGLWNRAKSLAASQNGYGKDLFQLEFDQITHFLLVRLTDLRVFYAALPLYPTTIVLTKIVILLLYKRIFVVDPLFLRLAYGTGIICIAYWITFVVVDIFQCTPVSYAWTRWDGEHEGSCIAYLPAVYAVSIINIALDVWIMVLPWPRLLQMKMHWKKKIHALLMFSVGAFITIISALRLSSLQEYSDTPNPTWDWVAIGYYSFIEASVGVVCTCMPDIRTLLVRIWPALSGSTYPDSNERHSGRSPAIPTQVNSHNALSRDADRTREHGKYYKQQDSNVLGSRKGTRERDDIDCASAAELIEMESTSRIGSNTRNSSWESLHRDL
ncbi:hypothetical protein EDB80DRAFT_658527 [Ilyonectria destructans]|nr:hypothetical protein EDB80DRAFT_658527 [Ilyonectria destructans]